MKRVSLYVFNLFILNFDFILEFIRYDYIFSTVVILPVLYIPFSPDIIWSSYMPGLNVVVNDRSILPLVLFTHFSIVIPLTFIARLVFLTSSSPVSSVIVALIVVLLFLVVILSVFIVTPFFVYG